MNLRGSESHTIPSAPTTLARRFAPRLERRGKPLRTPAPPSALCKAASTSRCRGIGWTAETSEG